MPLLLSLHNLVIVFCAMQCRSAGITGVPKWHEGAGTTGVKGLNFILQNTKIYAKPSWPWKVYVFFSQTFFKYVTNNSEFAVKILWRLNEIINANIEFMLLLHSIILFIVLLLKCALHLAVYVNLNRISSCVLACVHVSFSLIREIRFTSSPPTLNFPVFFLSKIPKSKSYFSITSLLISSYLKPLFVSSP